MTYSDSDMPEGADVPDSTPSGSRPLMLAALVVWAVVVAGAVTVPAAGSLIWPLIFVTLTLVIVGAAALSLRFRVIEQVTVLAFVALALVMALAVLAGSHRATRVDASTRRSSQPKRRHGVRAATTACEAWP